MDKQVAHPGSVSDTQVQQATVFVAERMAVVLGKEEGLKAGEAASFVAKLLRTTPGGDVALAALAGKYVEQHLRKPELPATK